MLLAAGVKHIIACDENGILYKDRGVGIKDHKEMLCGITNLEDKRGDLADALVGADVFIGVSVGGALKPEMIKTLSLIHIWWSFWELWPWLQCLYGILASLRESGMPCSTPFPPSATRASI